MHLLHFLQSWSCIFSLWLLSTPVLRQDVGKRHVPRFLFKYLHPAFLLSYADV